MRNDRCRLRIRYCELMSKTAEFQQLEIDF